MNRLILILAVVFFNAIVVGQDPDGDYNPFVRNASITPSPLSPVEADGTGVLNFNIGNSEEDDLTVYTGEFIILTITLSYGVPDNVNPVAAIGGNYSSLFSWTYNSGIYTGRQIATIPDESSGNISIAYRVTRNSSPFDPQNGFRVVLTPANYQRGDNDDNDDETSYYTWTEIRDFGDAPSSYGSADHIIDMERFIGSLVDGENENQPSAAANADDLNGLDDEDGVTFPELIRGTTVSVRVVVRGDAYLTAWADWNGDGDFGDGGERIVANLRGINETLIIPVSIPQSAIISRPTFTRFRFGPRNIGPTGSAAFGEVEDHQITIQCDPPSAPVIGTITQPTCIVPTGSVNLSGLPTTGTWTLIRSPGEVTMTGTGSSVTVTGLNPGTYTFIVNSDGCASPSSGNVVINNQPQSPDAPVRGAITHPTCEVATGSVVLTGLPSGTWTINPGSITGSTSSTTISGLRPGEYNFTVTNSAGCISDPTSDVVINEQPPSPANPVQTIDCSLGFNHAVITVTSPVGSGLVYRLDNGTFQSSPSFAGVVNGNHTITVRNEAGCTTTGSSFTVFCACINPPALSLNGESGSVCGTSESVTISGNTFGGSATGVTIAENGFGSVSPSLSQTTPFSFTYTPAAGDADRTVIITVSTNNPLGTPCEIATSTFLIRVNSIPSPPVIGTVTPPSCAVATGSVRLTGLPSTGTWTITRNPGEVPTTGTGTGTTISGIPPGVYNFTVRSAGGCISGASQNAVISQPPDPIPEPVIEEITHPTCNISTGSVALSGLPSTGTWSLIRNPGNVSVTGSGSTRTVSGIPEGTFTFTVINSSGCTSLPSDNVVINEQPETPSRPSAGTRIQPSCNVATGSVILNNLPATGTWTLTRFPGSIQSTGTGVSTTVIDLIPGTYNFTITNSHGCTSNASANIVINAQPPTPSAPVVGQITQPTCPVPSGTVQLTGLPSGTWTLTRMPDNLTRTGTGSSTSVSELLVGTYNFTVTNSFGCQSTLSANVVILPNPAAPVITITNPDPVCSPSTVDITSPSITSGSTPGLVYTYWRNPDGTRSLANPGTAGPGTYYIKGTDNALCTDIKPVVVIVLENPVASAGPDQTLEYQFDANLIANEPGPVETGSWSVFSGSGTFNNSADAVTSVNGLAMGRNVILWTMTNGVCPPSADSVVITVLDLIIPTLITPNNDGRNDYFIITGIDSQGIAELMIFDRRGARIYRNENYDNSWDGIDDKGNPVPDDTYFYVINFRNGRSRTGFIVVRH